MGTHTDFIGAIRIVPQVEEPLASRLDTWLSLRHMRRFVPALEALYPSEEERKAHTLFGDGDFGVEGELYLQDRTKDLDMGFFHEDPLPEGLTDNLAMNYAPKNCPCLYSNLALVQSPDGMSSYLGWDGSDKAYCISDWIELIAGYLVPLGYHLEGRMFAIVEYGCEFYSIRVWDTNVQTEEFIPDTTYQAEFDELFNY